MATKCLVPTYVLLGQWPTVSRRADEFRSYKTCALIAVPSEAERTKGKVRMSEAKIKHAHSLSHGREVSPCAYTFLPFVKFIVAGEWKKWRGKWNWPRRIHLSVCERISLLELNRLPQSQGSFNRTVGHLAIYTNRAYLLEWRQRIQRYRNARMIGVIYSACYLICMRNSIKWLRDSTQTRERTLPYWNRSFYTFKWVSRIPNK